MNRLIVKLAFVFGSIVCFDYKKDKIRGVNLGGWLVLEPWITPSFFEPFKGKSEGKMAVDEYTYTKILKGEAKKKLESHWSSFVTDNDFRILKEAGINHVRIPVGYWAFNKTKKEPFIDGSLQHLIRGVKLARQHEIKVMVDIHGAPLSQNGFDNSGRAGKARFLNDTKSGPRMLDVLEKTAKLFAGKEYRDTVTAIQLVNEPANWLLDMEKLKKFYEDGYKVIRNHNPEVMVTFHDAFWSVDKWEYLAKKPKVMLDTHYYNVFDEYLVKMNHQQHLNHSCGLSGKLEKSKSLMPTFVGEWSLASTDCTLYLNGFMKGSRVAGNFKNHESPRLPANYDFKKDKCAQYDHISKFPSGQKKFLKEFFEKQISVYENAGSGWFFWNFKAENSPEWNFIMGVKEGWIKIPTTTKNTCKSS
ncbi:hypothetical protein DSO57_1034839 [Entomophthora muscae]|uniref:Uncharacterized protein n=1 Tax=Entomophthora muscae TaxID=34485 RepID=A0ACC2SCE5_9FUNG|nr:hypothetical protein DSO57_1034839 [Entomophthora muscae]